MRSLFATAIFLAFFNTNYHFGHTATTTKMFSATRAFFKKSISLGKRFLQTFEKHLELQGAKGSNKFYYLWLRDNCRCKDCYNKSTNQISFDVIDLSHSIKPAELSEKSDSLNITWNDGHKSEYSINYLKSLEFGNRSPKRKIKTWDSKSVEKLTDTTVEAAAFLSSNDSVKELLQSVLKNGFGIVKNVEPTIEATRKVAERIGIVQKTFFKEMHDLLSGAQFSDTAYTNIPLGAHTDNTYFTEAAGIQVFHMLSHDGKGGETLLVDGFKAIMNLQKSNPAAFDLLCKEVLEYRYIEDGVHYSTLKPVIGLHPYTNEIEQIRYNAYDRGTLLTVSESNILAYYSAYKSLGVELRKPENERWLRLRPGNVLFIDNWRVLHGRAGFTGSRRLAGCYLSRSEWLSKCRTLDLPIV